uniref:Acyl-coenzyme A thioesterase 13 n=1 Tax=Davidia involucrata TaxID=16924 RepID=A0A5B7BHB9_DAVIN
MEDDIPQKARKLLEGLSKGLGHELEAVTLEGMQVELAQKGLIRCNFVIPKHLSDQDGNWQAGAIAVLVDNVGAAAIFSSFGHLKASVAFDISYYSTAKIQEEVEIEAKVAGHKGKLASVVVKIKKKDSGEMIAMGKQWMTSVNVPQLSRL